MQVAHMLSSATGVRAGPRALARPDTGAYAGSGKWDGGRMESPALVGGGNQRAALSQFSTRVITLRKNPSILSVTSRRSSPLSSPA
jgi:hypothetical protein